MLAGSWEPFDVADVCNGSLPPAAECVGACGAFPPGWASEPLPQRWPQRATCSGILPWPCSAE